jgi:peptidoglycan/xylan/chitin deacetylase (PgdA/CDA1 family)
VKKQRLYPYVFPKLGRWFYPKAIYQGPDAKSLYLTFDDGPTPEITQWVMKELDKYQGKGTFFLIGDKAERYPEAFRQALNSGHQIGHHTQHHVNGFKTPDSEYFKEVEAVPSEMKTTLFRPPYGRIRRSQYRKLAQKYHVVLWDVLSGDFDLNATGEECARAVIQNAKGGSVVVFHDSEKAWDRLKIALPMVLKHFSEKGYSFKALPA